MGKDSTVWAVCGVLYAVCALAGAVSASAEPRQALPVDEIPHTQPPLGEAEAMLHAHNAERERLGLAPLAWNAALARDAGQHGKILVARGGLDHAQDLGAKGQGENLWMGTAGAWNGAAMVQMFLDERQHYREAAFPDVSATGKWKDVGHYTQIVWRETKEVGCAIETGNGMDVLVCRYFPAGNVLGRKAY